MLRTLLQEHDSRLVRHAQVSERGISRNKTLGSENRYRADDQLKGHVSGK
jgi:hypothetical protein